MVVNILKSKTVCLNSGRFMINIGFSHYNLGVNFHTWGIRLMLIWWHICIHFKNLNK